MDHRGDYEMIKISFLVGLFESLLIFILCIVLNKISMGFKVLGIVGILFLLLSAILSGSLGSGDRIRLNYAVEDKTLRNSRISYHISAFLIGFTNIIFSLILLFKK